MKALENRVALVTGASSGIGEATARALARAGARLAIGARRSSRLGNVCDEISRDNGVECLAAPLDVTSPGSCDRFVSAALDRYARIDILVNSAGLARGRRTVAEGDEREWNEMIDTNVKGLLTMTRLALAHMTARNAGHIVNLGSVAGLGVYEGGSVYCATKWAVKAISQTLRLELNGTDIRVTEICPGLVETEFSLVRFHREEDEQRARKQADDVYRGMKPLTAEDIAEIIVWAVTRPAHVDVDEIVVRPVAQAGMGKVARKT